MSLPENQDIRKSPESKELNPNEHNNSPYEFDKFQVRDKGKHWTVRLRHRWIKDWFRVLHPMAVKLWCVLKMHACWENGPDYGKTGDWYTRRSLQYLTGAGHNSIDRALHELHFYGLLKFEEPNPEMRRRRGKCCLMILDDSAKAPSEKFQLTHQELEELPCFTAIETGHGKLPCGNPVSPVDSNVGAPTTYQNGVTPLPQNGVTPLPQNGVRSLPQNGVTQIGSNKVEENKNGVPSSSSVSMGDKKATTTTTQPSGPNGQPQDLLDLTPLSPMGGIYLDRVMLERLWTEARQSCPDITVQELGHVLSSKVGQCTGPNITHPPAYLVEATCAALRSGWLGRWRADQAERRGSVAQVVNRASDDDLKLAKLHLARERLYASPEWAEMNHEEQGRALGRLKQQYM